ncbi:MAG: sigma-54-dependent Fis family transcriptional regulator [Polyangiaceae bacterium]|nr:sigma-54-dependent Fis family transcriptional regulator [Polyangiaceae bacterium]
MHGAENTPGNVLLVEDDAAASDMVAKLLQTAGHEVTAVPNAEAALDAVALARTDLVLADVQLGGMDGLELCRALADTNPELPVIVLTGFGSLETAVSAIRAGAYDFVTKPVELETLLHAVGRAIRKRTLERELTQLQCIIHGPEVSELIGSSSAMERVLDLIRRAADSDATVLVTGESGTGKELVARALHRCGARGDAPFIAVDCASIPATMLESELFGHTRGAFTDARSDRRGLFSQADGGTLFLDEIGEMPQEMQAKLLRALQERRVRPVGSDTELEYDARVVAATNRDLETEVSEKRFRSDLYYRLNVVRIELPPLRARGSDVLELAGFFLAKACERSGKGIDGFVRQAAEKLLAYDWPGNVRELANCIEGAVALATQDKITLDDLPAKIREHRGSMLVPSSNDPRDLIPMAELERRYIRRVLAAVGGNKTQAAKILGLERRTLYRKLERYGAEGDNGSSTQKCTPGPATIW